MNSLNLLSYKLVLIAATLMGALAAHAADLPQDTCQPVLQKARTEFSQKSQLQGEHGTVRVQLQIGTNGRASAVTIAQSSGYTALDRAAADSIRKYWEFDVAHCAPEQLQNTYDVSVHFERAKGYTVANTVDRKSVASSKALANSDQCFAADDVAGGQVFSCVAITGDAVAARNANPVAQIPAQ